MARRAQLKASLEILSLLPDDSGARTDLLEHVDRRLRDLIRREDHETRNWFNALGGAYVAVVCLIFGLAQYPTVWLVPLYGLFSVLGGAACYDGIRKGVRGDHGFRLGRAVADATAAERTPEHQKSDLEGLT